MARLLRFLWSLTHPIRAWGPRCGDPAPATIEDDIAPCCIYRGHDLRPGQQWHGDGTGYVWHNSLREWRWMGSGYPPVKDTW